MESLPPVILPGGGRFKTNGVFVSIRHQSTPPLSGHVIRWRFAMNPAGRSNHENGPTIEGRIPGRPEVAFEECYQFCSSGKMGYRRPLPGGQYNLEFGIPGTYRVYAWIERVADGQTVSATQSCVFDLVSPSDSSSAFSPPSLSLGC